MKLKQIGANQTELHLNNGTIVLFSYETPVAAIGVGVNRLKTSKKWSRTTSKHITQWFKPFAGYDNLVEVDQSVLNALVK